MTDSADKRVDDASICQANPRSDRMSIGQSVTALFGLSTDLLGYRFYLPAYMRWTIKNHRQSDNIIADFTIYALDPNNRPFTETRIVDWLTKNQIDANLAFLFFCTLNDDSLDAQAAMKNTLAIREMLV